MRPFSSSIVFDKRENMPPEELMRRMEAALANAAIGFSALAHFLTGLREGHTF
jgi:hypothetical protein